MKADAMPNGDGLSWETAYAFLQDALSAARTSGGTIHEIWVAAGTYKPDRDATHPNGTGDRSATFGIVDGVALRGGFLGNEDPTSFDLGTRDLQANQSILSGDLAGDDTPNFGHYGENSYHIVSAPSIAQLTALDGFTVSRGNANGNLPFGGGLYNLNSNLNLINCTFSLNSASYGAGVCNSGSSPTLTNCIFTGNRALNAGGGMNSASGDHPTLLNCKFIANTSLGAGGGMVSGPGNNITLTGCEFSGNAASSMEGGGLYNVSSNPTLTNCTFIGNSASSGGGGIYNGYPSSGSPVGSNPRLINCTFNGNSATSNSGGAVYNSRSNPTIINCRFIGNSAQTSSRKGGGVYNDSVSKPVVSGCLFSGNSAYNGGGMYNESGDGITLTNCTMTGNTASATSSSPAGGVASQSGTLTLVNCIIWDNHIPQFVFGNAQISGSATATYSCVQGGWAGTGNTSSNPLFVDAANFRLSAGSPCIDAGQNAAVPLDLATDLDGHTRFFEDPATVDCRWAPGTCGAAPIVDMGAYEFVTPVSVLGWRSVRNHNGTLLSIALNPAATGNGSTGPTVESRMGGIQRIEIDFDGPVTLANPGAISFTDGTNAYVPSAVSATNLMLAISFDAGMLPDQKCYTITLGSGLLDKSIVGSNTCKIRALAGDTTGDGAVTLSDAIYTQSLANAATPSSQVPRCDIDLNGQITSTDAVSVKAKVISPAIQAPCP